MITTKAAAIHTFLSGFGLTAYAAASVPSNAEYPYLTYELTVGSWMDGSVSLPVNLWYRTTGEAVLNSKVQEISDKIGMGGCQVDCDGGSIWVLRGTPFAQSLSADADDNTVKRRYVNLELQFNTAD